MQQSVVIVTVDLRRPKTVDDWRKGRRRAQFFGSFAFARVDQTIRPSVSEFLQVVLINVELWRLIDRSLSRFHYTRSRVSDLEQGGMWRWGGECFHGVKTELVWG